MDTRRMLLFATVAEHGSVTRAAMALHLSQPSLSRQISQLEREVGLRLLHRTPTGVVPTRAGELLLRRAKALRAQLEAARREVLELRELETGELRLAAFPTAAATLALDAFTILRSRHPGLGIVVEERDRASALDRVLTGDADIALTFGAAADGPPPDLLSTELLHEEEMLLAVPEGHPSATEPIGTLRDLADAPWIVGTGGPGLIVQACLRAGFEPRVVARLDNQPAIQGAVAAGVGVTLIPTLAARHPHPGIALRRLEPPPPTRRILMHVAAGPRQPATDAGLAAIRHAAARLDAPVRAAQV